jgi:predicted SAM-dependent methyltransferase
MLPLLGKFEFVLKLLVRMGLLSNNYLVKWPKFRLVDIRKGIPHDDKSVDYIYCSHVLEHFEKWETEKILRECRRVLKKSGMMRIVLPDLERLVSKYKVGDAEKFCREFYGFDKDVKSWQRIFIRGHEWMYDKVTFVDLLKKTGFEKIEISKRLNSKMPDVEKLDLAIHEELSAYYEVKW